MLRIAVLLSTIVLVVFLSGCGGIIPTDGFADDVFVADVITIEDYYVTNTKPLPNTSTTIGFLVKNNADYTMREKIPKVEVSFFDVPGFTVKKLTCEGGSKSDNTCVFVKSGSYDEIVPGDSRVVKLELVSPKNIISATELTVSYSISYDIMGKRRASIPLVDGTTRIKPLSQFSQSPSSDGPVVVELKPPKGAERIEEGQTIEEYYSRLDEPFNVELSFEDVGSGSIGEVQPTVIGVGKVKLDVSNGLQIEPGLRCDFGTNFLSTKEVEVPGKLVCNLKGSSSEPEVIVPIYIDYSYTYKYIKTQAFTVVVARD